MSERVRLYPAAFDERGDLLQLLDEDGVELSMELVPTGADVDARFSPAGSHTFTLGDGRPPDVWLGDHLPPLRYANLGYVVKDAATGETLLTQINRWSYQDGDTFTLIWGGGADG